MAEFNFLLEKQARYAEVKLRIFQVFASLIKFTSSAAVDNKERFQHRKGSSLFTYESKFTFDSENII